MTPPKSSLLNPCKFLLIAGIALAALLGTPAAKAATYYWDNNGATTGFGTAAGTWAAPTTNSGTQGWSTDATGLTLPSGTTTTLNTNNTTDALNFGNGATGLAAGTITVSGTVAAGDMTFASGSGATGTPAPVDPAAMPFLANETKMPHRNDFDATDLGKTASYAARWVNTKGDSGPWSQITGWIIN